MKTIFVFILLLVGVTYSQKSIILPDLSASQLNIVNGNDIGVVPGDTIIIPSGTYAGLRFIDVQGTNEHPVVIINKYGKVNLVEPTVSAVEFWGCTFIRFSGSGHASINHGFDIKATNNGAHAINITALSTNVELDHLLVSQAGFAGIMAKTDPSCNSIDALRDNFTMRDIYIHDNIITNTLGEGIYIGYTGSRLHASSYLCDGIPIYAHWSENIRVEKNTFENIGFDAVQLCLVRSGGVIRDNIIRNYATRREVFQDFAMSIGTGYYEIFNNRIINDIAYQGRGIQFLSAFGGSKVYNNLIVEPKQHGIFVHMRDPFQSDQGYLIANNTIIKPEIAGIFYNTVILEYENEIDYLRNQDEVVTLFINNLIVEPIQDFDLGNTWKSRVENFIDFNSISTRDAMQPYIQNNLFSENLNDLNLDVSEEGEFSLTEASTSLIDNGQNLSNYEIFFDINNILRPQGNSFDIGAFEFVINQNSEEDEQESDGDNDQVEDDANESGEIEIPTNAFSQNRKLLFVPNPVAEEVLIPFEDEQIIHLWVFNTSGQQILSINNHSTNDKLNLSSLLPGEYLVSALSNKGPMAGILLKVTPKK